MASGLDVPVSAGKDGGAVVVDGGEQIKKLLMIALRPCPSANPFQDLGLAGDIIFRINDPLIESEITLEIERLFKFFETRKRARLASRPVYSRSKEGELTVEIEYVDLETSRAELLSLTLPGAKEQI